MRNIACLMIFFLLILVFGALFHGCRLFLLSIYDGLYSLQGQYFSLSHLIAYSIYLIIGDIFKIKLYGKIVSFMIYIKNASSDVVERNLKSFFTFYYLLVIELIPIFFFLMLEPFLRTTCYAFSCEHEFYYYLYARFLFNFIMVGFSVIQVIWIMMKRTKEIIEEELIQKEEINTFQNKLKRMLTSAIDEGNK